VRPCRRGSPSRSFAGMRSAAGTDRLDRWRARRGRPAARYGPQRAQLSSRSSRHRSRYPAAGHAASGHGRSLGRGEHRGDQPCDLDRGRRRRGPCSGPTSRSPTACVGCGKTHPRSSANSSPTAADCSPHVPRRHATRHNHRGSRHRPGYDQIQPTTAASNDQNQAGDLSAAPQSRAWTADNTGLLELQRSRSYCVAAVSDIWLGCLAPRKSGRGEMAAMHQTVRAVSAASRVHSMQSMALMPSMEIVSLHLRVRDWSAEVRYAGRPMSLRHQRLMARSTTWAWVPTVNGSRLSTSHPSSWTPSVVARSTCHEFSAVAR
jgi:hypothetical protein